MLRKWLHLHNYLRMLQHPSSTHSSLLLPEQFPANRRHLSFAKHKKSDIPHLLHQGHLPDEGDLPPPHLRARPHRQPPDGPRGVAWGLCSPHPQALGAPHLDQQLAQVLHRVLEQLVGIPACIKKTLMGKRQELPAHTLLAVVSPFLQQEGGHRPLTLDELPLRSLAGSADLLVCRGILGIPGVISFVTFLISPKKDVITSFFNPVVVKWLHVRVVPTSSW